MIRQMTLIHRQWIRRWIPQGLRSILNRALGFSIIYRGKFDNWESAQENVAGYDAPDLFKHILFAAEQVKNGLASWEKDGITFDKVPTNFFLWACFGRVALANHGRLSVLDFGGAFGSSYHQCRSFLTNEVDLQWSIVEQEHVVKAGREKFSTQSLKFYLSIELCLKSERPNLVLLSSVLQYLEFPYDLLTKIAQSNVEYLLIDRHPCSFSGELITTQILPPKWLYPGSYVCRLFDCQEMLEWLDQYYELLVSFDNDDVDPPIYGRGFGANSKGFLLRKRETH